MYTTLSQHDRIGDRWWWRQVVALVEWVGRDKGDLPQGIDRYGDEAKPHGIIIMLCFQSRLEVCKLGQAGGLLTGLRYLGWIHPHMLLLPFHPPLPHHHH
jgi:hypothetical protein